MKLTARHHFKASPDRVLAMLTDPAFLAHACERLGAHSHEVTVDGEASGSPTTSTRAVVEAPSEVSRFIGKTLTVVQTVAWGPRTASGGRDGRLDIAVPGLPVTLTGAAALSGTDAETSIDYDGELTVNVPFVDRQIEEQAAPEITGVLNSQQAIGEEWLATH